MANPKMSLTVTVADLPQVKTHVEKLETRIKDLELMLGELIEAGNRSIDRQLEIDLTPLLKARWVLAGNEYEPTPKTIG